MEITASTRVLTILGDPVEHSLSPAMHNAACRALGRDAVYVAWRVFPGDLDAVLTALARLGIAGNVTVPHKEAVAERLRRTTALCQRTGACNTFWAEQGELVGDNTDVLGIQRSLGALGADGAERWLVIGTGGAARAAVVAAAEAKAQVLVRSREAGRAELFAEWARSRGVRAQRAADPVDADLAINASVLGLRTTDPAPIAPEQLRGVRVALDCVYAPGETAWVQSLRAAGIVAADGREMLVHQGAAAFARWFPDAPTPVEVMRAAVRRELERGRGPGA